MNSRSIGMLIGTAVIVVALIGWSLLGRSGRQTGEQPPAFPDAGQSLKPGERVRQRLEQMRGAQPAMPSADKPGGIQARSSIHAEPKAIVPRGNAGQPGHAQVGGGNQPEAVAEGVPFDEDPDDIPTLKNVALSDADPERRLTAVTLLGASEDASVIPTLAQALSDKDEEVRMAALQSLSDFTDEPPVEAIESALNDPTPDIRMEAVGILGDIGGERARAAVARALNDPDEDVRSLAEGIMDVEPDESDANGAAVPAPAP